MGECIEHTQKGANNGYGNTARTIAGVKRHMPLHRAVFWDTYGYLPEVVRHTCDNTRCINPAHLLPGTQKDNMQDCIRRGRISKPPVKRVLSTEDVATIRSGKYTVRELLGLINASETTIRQCKRGFTYV